MSKLVSFGKLAKVFLIGTMLWKQSPAVESIHLSLSGEFLYVYFQESGFRFWYFVFKAKGKIRVIFKLIQQHNASPLLMVCGYKKYLII